MAGDLDFRVDLTGADEANAKLDTLGDRIEDAGRSTTETTKATAGLEAQYRSLLASLDPAAAALAKLTEGAKTVSAMQAAGTITAKEAQEVLIALTAKYEPLINKTKELTTAHGELHLHSSLMIRELRSLFGELSSGESERAMATLGIMAARIFGVSGSILLFAAAAAGVVAPIVLVVKNFEELHSALAEMGAQFEATGRDITASHLKERLIELTSLPGVSQKQAVESLMALNEHAVISTGLFEKLTGVLADYAAATGKSVPAAAQDLGKAFSDVTKGAKELNDRFNFLDAAQMKQIDDLQKSGDLVGAQGVLYDALAERIKGLHEKGITPLSAATEEFNKQWKGLMDSMSDSGAVKQADGLLVDFMNDLAKWTKATKEYGPGGFIRYFLGMPADKGLLQMMFSDANAATPNVSSGPGDAAPAPPAPAGPQLNLQANAALELSKAYQQLEDRTGALSLTQQNLVKGINAAVILQNKAAVDQNAESYARWEEVIKQLNGAIENVTGQIEKLNSQAPAIKAQAQLAYDAVKFSMDNQQKELDLQYHHNLMTYQDYFNKRLVITLALIDADEKRLKKEMEAAQEEQRIAELTSGTGSAQHQQATASVNKLGQQLGQIGTRRGTAATENQFAKGDAALAMYKEVEQARAKLLADTDQTTEAAVAQMNMAYSTLLTKLIQMGDEAGYQIVSALFNAAVAKAQLTDIEKSFEATMATLQAAEKRVDLEVKTGLVSEFEGRQRLVGIMQEQIAVREKEIAKIKESNLDTITAQKEIAKLQGEVDKLKGSVATMPTTMLQGAQRGAQQYSAGVNAPDITKEFTMHFLQSIENALADTIRHGRFNSEAFTNAIKDEISKSLAKGVMDSLSGIWQPVITAIFSPVKDVLSATVGKALAETFGTAAVKMSAETVMQVEAIEFAAFALEESAFSIDESALAASLAAEELTVAAIELQLAAAEMGAAGMGEAGGLAALMAFPTGTDAVYSTPTLFMAGDVPERVSIKPLSGGGGDGPSGGGVTFNGPNIIDSYSMKKFKSEFLRT